MPCGKTHLKIESTIALVLFPSVFYLSYTWPKLSFINVSCFCVGYLLGSFFLNPDMDLFKSDGLNRWGPFKYFWLPYSKICKHRGLSHSWLFGSATRFSYLLIFAIPFIYFFPEILDFKFKVLFVFFGCWFANALHLIADRHWAF